MVNKSALSFLQKVLEVDCFVLTISWPVGPEEDWTASGWYEPEDLYTDTHQKDRTNEFMKEMNQINDIIVCREGTCEVSAHHFVMRVEKLSIFQPGRLRNGPI